MWWGGGCGDGRGLGAIPAPELFSGRCGFRILGTDGSGCESGWAVWDLVECRKADGACWGVVEEMFVAIEEFDECPLDVVIPLVPGFERKVFEPPFRFPLRHLPRDHSAGAFECEVLKACFCGKTDRSVDKQTRGKQ